MDIKLGLPATSIFWTHNNEERTSAIERWHRVAFILAGIFSLVSLAVSVHLIRQHQKHWSKPRIQRKIVGILWMVPIYAITSWLSLRFKDAAVYLDMFRDCYEGYVIYLFLALMIAYLGNGNEYKVHDILNAIDEPLAHPYPMNLVLDPIPLDASFLRRCKFGVMQFVAIKPIMTLFAAFLESQRLYEKGEFRFDRGYAYVSFVQNVSISWAFYDLALFYIALKSSLKPFDPVPKFLAIKAVLFLSFWQGVLLATLAQFDIIDQIGNWTVENVSTGVQNWLICFEMSLCAFAHIYAFPYQPFVRKPSVFQFSADGLRSGLLNDNLAVHDAINDFNQVAPGRVPLPSSFRPGNPTIVHYSNVSNERERQEEGVDTAALEVPKQQRWLERDTELHTTGFVPISFPDRVSHPKNSANNESQQNELDGNYEKLGWTK
eukprot:CAMPEP_0184042492 /NCGR_PEP_ID=MMETSP0955-20130417/66375_1 /TAXON_ID=627963 /ORGANISM="Aplanochytrium sp, Strain PBS07" /LENGTH=432 /DNA_ID=CAMNT_0026333253 /DNA_START=134 /DNA_END=1432 /DNA_ORIENTATION=-